jgi:PAS domain S-box-containing protein
MKADELRLPGQIERPGSWTPPPTTPARSWAELVETLQGGMALLDDDWNLVFVSERFLPSLGRPDDLVGHDVRQLLPSLADDDPRGFQQQIERGDRVEFEEQFHDGDGDRGWFQVAVVPSTGLGDDLAAVVFAKDITTTSKKLAQLRDAAAGLTEVESELHRRAGRDVHDGPIQLLAALMFRLGMTNTEEARQLQQTVSDVATDLRQVIATFSPELHRSEADMITQWISPFLVDSEIEVEVEDRRAHSGHAETQAAFVLLYHVVRGVKYFGGRRDIRMVLTDDDGGERFYLVFQSSNEHRITVGRPRAQYRAIAHHARALGGTLSTWMDQNEVRRMAMWIPKLSTPAAAPEETLEPAGELSASRFRNDVALLPPLSDSTWREVVTAAPERLIEFDDRMRLSFANAIQHDLAGTTPDELIGSSVESMFDPESLRQLTRVFEQLDAGEFVVTDWYRENALGDTRLIHLTISPRLDEAGQWQGLFLATDDHTDIDLIESMYQQSLRDLAVARRLTIERSIRLLRQPLADCEQLIDRLHAMADISGQSEPVRTITIELEAALRRIEDSTSALVSPQLSVSDLDAALRASLGTLLMGRRMVVIDNTDPPLSTEIADVLFRITREAVNNAVLHGGAGLITITLANVAAGVSCDIHDNGVGVDPDRLQHRPGHLGTRAMRERAREWGGTCRIEQDPQGGTVVNVWLPDHAVRSSIPDSSTDG